VLLESTTRPRLLMLQAAVNCPPRVPRSIVFPFSQSLLESPITFENMKENWPEERIGETVDVAFEDRAIVECKLVEVNDNGIVLEEQTHHEAGPVVAGDDVEQEVGTVRERPVTITHHIFYPWSTLVRLKMFVSITKH
jgi:hypothetical protein